MVENALITLEAAPCLCFYFLGICSFKLRLFLQQSIHSYPGLLVHRELIIRYTNVHIISTLSHPSKVPLLSANVDENVFQLSGMSPFSFPEEKIRCLSGGGKREEEERRERERDPG